MSKFVTAMAAVICLTLVSGCSRPTEAELQAKKQRQIADEAKMAADAAAFRAWSYSKTVENKKDEMNDKKWTVTRTQASLNPVGYWDSTDLSKFAGASLSVFKTDNSLWPKPSLSVDLFPTSGLLASPRCWEACSVRVRFDSKPPIDFEVHGAPYGTAGGGQSRFLEVDDAEKFINNLATAKKVKIEVPFVPSAAIPLGEYKMVISEFDAAGFSLDK